MNRNLLILIFALIIGTAMHTVQAQTYDPHAVEVINNLIAHNGLQATPNAPETWAFATWNNETPKQIIELELTKKYGYMDGDASFANLTTLQVLDCKWGYLKKLNVTNCTQLKELYCGDNRIAEIDLTNCTQLQRLSITMNQIYKLDITHCKQLQYLWHQSNHLIDIDLSGLNNFIVYFDEMQSRDLTLYKNEAEEYILTIFLNNPSFDKSAISYSDGILKSTDKNITYCNFTTQTNKQGYELSGVLKFIYSDDAGIDSPESEQLKIYPNPTTGELIVTSYKLRVTSVEVFDVNGKKQEAKNRKQKAEGKIVIDISLFPTGIYFVKVFTEQGEVVRKIVKQ